MTNANGLILGRVSLAAHNCVCTASWVGGGKLVQRGTTITMDNSSPAVSSGMLATLDLSGLSDFVATSLTTLNIAGSGNFSVSFAVDPCKPQQFCAVQVP